MIPSCKEAIARVTMLCSPLAIGAPITLGTAAVACINGDCSTGGGIGGAGGPASSMAASLARTSFSLIFFLTPSSFSCLFSSGKFFNASSAIACACASSSSSVLPAFFFGAAEAGMTSKGVSCVCLAASPCKPARATTCLASISAFSLASISARSLAAISAAASPVSAGLELAFGWAGFSFFFSFSFSWSCFARAAADNGLSSFQASLNSSSSSEAMSSPMQASFLAFVLSFCCLLNSVLSYLKPLPPNPPHLRRFFASPRLI
mmetsp:Transcript_91228/g.144109  ORF Transcript_91228/g.144109 Transcript_91228/m.144109 type:complete len:263 (+) Transcript_91228:519-1307(+)